jgi:molybdopterin molybdotransferase
MSAAPLTPVDEALARVLASVAAPTEPEEVALAEACGRTLASDVAARRVQPPFANSAMDGYALRAEDATAASARLTVVGESAAGRPFAGRVRPGEAARIFTGAPLPEGADAVAMQEKVRRDGDVVILDAPVAPGAHVRPRGGDFGAGEILLRAGRRLTGRDVALAAAANHPTLMVRRRPRVAILANGDELIRPGVAMGPSQIVSSNTYAVAAIVAAAGGAPIDLGVAADDPAALADKLAQAVAERADALVTLGGASVGDHDLTRQALLNAGMDLGFWRVAMRPGKPLLHGRLGATIVLGLPGNPAPSTLCALLFLRPLIRALLGDPEAGADPSEPARLATPLPATGPRRDYARATLTRGVDGLDLATPLDTQDASLTKALADADALLVRPPNAPAASAGDVCRIIRLVALGA